MQKRNWLAIGLLASFLHHALARAEDKYIREDGVDYRVTKRVVSRPMSETTFQEHVQEVYKESYVTEIQDTTRLVTMPVTEYRWEAEWRNRWNPFGQPYMVHRLVPRTTWEMRTEVVQKPVVKRELVKEDRTVRVPVTRRWMAQEEVTHKLPLSPLSAGSAGALARREAIGGEKLTSDPPKVGSQLPARNEDSKRR